MESVVLRPFGTTRGRSTLDPLLLAAASTPSQRWAGSRALSVLLLEATPASETTREWREQV
jgi:hypothetical protein